MQTTVRGPHEDARLARVIEYVERFVPEKLNDDQYWTLWVDSDKEELHFRLRDPSTFIQEGASRALAVTIDLDALKFFEEEQLIKAVGDTFVEHLRAGLPAMPKQAAYPKAKIDV